MKAAKKRAFPTVLPPLLLTICRSSGALSGCRLKYWNITEMIETGAINLKKERERWERKGNFSRSLPVYSLERMKSGGEKKRMSIPITFFLFVNSRPGFGILPGCRLIERRRENEIYLL